MVYPIAKIRLTPLIGLLIKETPGLENVPVTWPFIIAANHESYVDHLIIVKTFAVYLNKKIHFLAKKEHFDNPLKAAWHRWGGAVGQYS